MVSLSIERPFLAPPTWEVDHRQEASTLASLRSDCDSLQEVLSSCAHTESKLLMETLQFGLLLSSFLSSHRKQPSGKKGSRPQSIQHVRQLPAKWDHVVTTPVFSWGRQNQYCRVNARRAEPQQTFVSQTASFMASNLHYSIRSGPHACNLTNEKAEAEGRGEFKFRSNNETLP